MHAPSGKIEDRVFGMPDRMPEATLITRRSTAYDLLSVTVEGAEVAYAQEGRVALPPLVFLHGWGASHKVWRDCFPAFSARRRCIAPDLVGWGRSEKPSRDWSIEAQAVWFGKFLDALRLPKVDLVAHSMGGAIGLLAAIDHPERIGRLVVVNPLIHGDTAFTLQTRCSMLPIVRTLIWAGAKVGPLRRWVARDFSYVQRLEPEIADDVVRGTYASAVGTMLACARFDARPKLAGLKAETFAIGSDRDLVIREPQYLEVPAARNHGFTETGHMPMLERPTEFNRVVHEFLQAR